MSTDAERADRLEMILDEVYEQRDHYRKALLEIYRALPPGDLKQQAADAVGYSFPNQKFRSSTL